MIKIAHRGNTSGPSHKENQPDHLMNAISSGYNVELDLWYIKGLLWLGHNGPEYLIKENFLLEIGSYAWIHCKNLDAIYFLNTTFPQLNYFWHENDRHTLTSQGYIWTYPGNPVTDRSVIVDLGGNGRHENAYAICSDNFNL